MQDYLFGVVPAGDMFKHIVDYNFKELLNVFGIADDILILGYVADGKEIKRILR